MEEVSFLPASQVSAEQRDRQWPLEAARHSPPRWAQPWILPEPSLIPLDTVTFLASPSSQGKVCLLADARLASLSRCKGYTVMKAGEQACLTWRPSWFFCNFWAVPENKRSPCSRRFSQVGSASSSPCARLPRRLTTGSGSLTTHHPGRFLNPIPSSPTDPGTGAQVHLPNCLSRQSGLEILSCLAFGVESSVPVIGGNAVCSP